MNLEDWLPWLNIGAQVGGSIISSNEAAQASADSSSALVQAYQDMLSNQQKAAEEGGLDLQAGYTPAFKNIQGAQDAILSALTGGHRTTANLLTEGAERKDQIYGDTASQIAQYMLQGVGGAGQELLTGAEQQLNALGGASDEAIAALQERGWHSRDALKQGYYKAFDDIDQGLTDALGLAKGGTYNFGGIKSLFDEYTGIASSKLDPYEQTGRSGLTIEASLAGALGADAQRAAFDQYMESPGQKYLRERQEQALLRNQAAIGGLGGGNVRTALQEQAKEIASTNLQTDIENLRSLATRGQQAAATQGGFYQASGRDMGAIRGELEGQRMAEQTKANLAKAQMAMDAARQKASLTGQGTETMSAQFQQEGELIAKLLEDAGVLESGVYGGLSTGLAGLEMDLGKGFGGIAEKYGDLQASNADQLATNLANLDQTTISNIINTIGPTAEQLSNMQINLGKDLANISLGLGTNTSNILQQIGEAQAANIMGGSDAFQSMMSDFGALTGGLLNPDSGINFLDLFQQQSNPQEDYIPDMI